MDDTLPENEIICRVDPSFKKLTWHCVVTEQDRFDFLLRQVFGKPTN
jgi:hypothetical protein